VNTRVQCSHTNVTKRLILLLNQASPSSGRRKAYEIGTAAFFWIFDELIRSVAGREGQYVGETSINRKVARSRGRREVVWRARRQPFDEAGKSRPGQDRIAAATVDDTSPHSTGAAFQLQACPCFLPRRFN
jgi:hypothetical protein